MKPYVLSTILLLTVILVGCQAEKTNDEDEGTESEDSAGDTLSIYTSLYVLEDFAAKIGGEFVEVESVSPPNADAHTYEPSSNDMVQIAESDAFIYSGLTGMEPFADTVDDALGDEDVRIIPAAENIDLRGEGHDDGEEDDDHGNGNDHQAPEDVEIEGLADHYHTGDNVSLTAELDEDVDYDHWHWYTRDEEDEEWETVPDQDSKDYEMPAEDGQELMAVLFDDDHEAYAQSAPVTVEIDDHDGQSGDGDPHIFLDPIRSIELAENIKDELVELMPEEEAYFVENFEQLRASLEDVDQELQQAFDEADHNQIIVSHAAYGYWEERYGLEQLSVHGLSSTEEPSQSDLTELVNTAEENNLGYVIFENNVSSNITEVIQNEIGAESLILRNMESISEDDLEAGEDYFSMMEMNIETLEMALND
ncbi:zinc transport system substrate-binding protein [Geomicrobium halophilum]|uniref:Zinc transport system substrate-binding protein n=1 Tax=Geomicrobium halophilum TaxID=549000 RepID=A0A841PQD9_9BACL|nr:zinc ABC transporter substrate-binding protein [Geomicrobium halophilum]MBB6450990.1 zinc transport system substrate-binding protein [Geomicrobium halophilum]